jgi:hypothetical protein
MALMAGFTNAWMAARVPKQWPTAPNVPWISTTVEALPAADSTIYVRTTGNDTTGDGSSGNPYATLVKALSVAPGSGICVIDMQEVGTFTAAAGTSGHTIAKSTTGTIYVQGHTSGVTLLAGNATATRTITFGTTKTTNIRFRNLTIGNGTVGLSTGVISFSTPSAGANNITFDNCIANPGAAGHVFNFDTVASGVNGTDPWSGNLALRNFSVTGSTTGKFIQVVSTGWTGQGQYQNVLFSNVSGTVGNFGGAVYFNKWHVTGCTLTATASGGYGFTTGSDTPNAITAGSTGYLSVCDVTVINSTITSQLGHGFMLGGNCGHFYGRNLTVNGGSGANGQGMVIKVAHGVNMDGGIVINGHASMSTSNSLFYVKGATNVRATDVTIACPAGYAIRVGPESPSAAGYTELSNFKITADGANAVALRIDNYEAAKTIVSDGHQYRVINGAVLAQALGIRGRTLSAQTMAGLRNSGWNPALLPPEATNDANSTLTTV